jgi:NAD(P)-dependent dehydrogenase (short-subunit alcohol dehydrogenase family)
MDGGFRPVSTMSEAFMTVDLTGRTFDLLGTEDAVLHAVRVALSANGARHSGVHADILIVASLLLPGGSARNDTPLQTIADAGRAMTGGGRIVFLLSALGGLPMRRHIEYSAAMASAVASMRGLAMQLAPSVLVNAVGAGVIESDAGELLAGDRHMLTHASLGRPGSLADITNAVLFLCDPLNTYTTGQLLTVDGGWSVGYGRNF